MGDGKDSKQARAPALAYSPSHLLHRAQQVAADEFAARLAHSGLTVRQFAVLTAVSGHPGLTQSNLVRMTGIDRSTLADLIARLQERGLVARDRLEEDGRAKSVTLTEAGRKVLAASEAKARAADEAILALLPKGKRQAFVTLLQRISGVSEADLAKGPSKGKAKALKPKKKAKSADAEAAKPAKGKAGKALAKGKGKDKPVKVKGGKKKAAAVEQSEDAPKKPTLKTRAKTA